MYVPCVLFEQSPAGVDVNRIVAPLGAAGIGASLKQAPTTATPPTTAAEISFFTM